jgi:hypothetical protein
MRAAQKQQSRTKESSGFHFKTQRQLRLAGIAAMLGDAQ